MKIPVIGKKPQGDPPVKALVYDEFCSKQENVLSSQVPAARKTQVKKRPVYVMERVVVNAADAAQTSELRPFNPTLAILDNDTNITPGELYGALDWEIEVSFEQVDSPWLQRIKSGVMIALVGICLFALFMIASSVFQG